MLQFKDRRLVTFGAHVKAIRLGKGLEYADLARETSLSKSDIAAIEEGSKNFAFTTLLELAKGLGVNPSNLLDFDIQV
ncbi:helix-turn-helix domain-containing protein [Flavobacterium suzhouense]|uniref:Helix-turn-helix domain-containing protein n=1 Tax=Flavobacterium suzhouense TaxID=1529638 RepID=A0ABW5NV35_9FLAO